MLYKDALERGANIIITDKDGKIVHVNDLFCATSQYSREELIGQNPRIFSSGHHSKQFWDEMYDTISSGNIWRGEVKNKAKDGSYHWLDTTVVPFMDQQGQPNQFLAMRYDITKRKELEASLQELNSDLEDRVELRTRESENRRKYFKALIENCGDAVMLLSAEGNIIYQSPAVERIGGYSVAESYGKQVFDYVQKEQIAAFMEMMARVAATAGYTETRQFQILHKKGHLVWVEGTISNQLHDENIRAYIVNYRDITKRKMAEIDLHRSEQLYRSLFENMLNGFAYCQMHFENSEPIDFTYLSTNGTFENLTGLKQVAGKRVSEVIPGFKEADPDLLERYARVASTGIPEQFETYVESLNDWYSISVYCPQQGYFVAVFDVITQRKNAEKALEKLNAELEERVLARTVELCEANKSLEAFAYSASHDLRAPVRTVLGFTKILDHDYADKLGPEFKELLSYIDKSGKRMNNIIEDLLALAKYGQDKLKHAPVDMTKLVNSVWSNIAITSPNQAKLEITGLPEVMADLSMIEQVVVNLISNAIKYSSKKEYPVIRVWGEQNQDITLFYFQDNGAGFDMKNYDRLFGAFQRLHGNNEFEGTGVGLALVKRIIEKHGGTIGATSKPGEGATFYFTLPNVASTVGEKGQE